MVEKADYYAFERSSHQPSQLSKAGPWDLFLSAYEDTDRVKRPFGSIQATCKQWIVQEEYDIPSNKQPHGAILLRPSFDSPAIEFVRQRINDLADVRLCIDSTGFIRPQLLVLLRAVRDAGVRSFDVLYSDPIRYIQDENTKFTLGPVTGVHQVPGYEGVHVPSVRASDILIIGAGYDVEQIAKTCDNRLFRKKYLLTGLPSLQPHMYHESVLQIEKASPWIGDLTNQQRLYASANQPFSVAQVLHDLTEREEQEALAQGQSRPNLYFCPIGPKPHTLGFAIYYLRELEGKSASIIYPYVNKYPRKTSQGLLRTWEYRIEL